VIHPKECTDAHGNLLRKPPPNMATLEHDRSRYSANRWELNPENKPRTRLLCFKCNQDNSARDTKALGPLLNVFATLPGKTRSDRRQVMRVLIREAQANVRVAA
jgi:hypothetical protein